MHFRFMSYFQQKLNTQLTSAFDLLSQLCDMTGLIYLHDQNSPIIAFLPQKFLLFQQSILKQFHQTEFNQYIQTETVSIIDFSSFDSKQAPQSDTCFNGGYIGFFSYDYSANQFVDVTHHLQPNFFLGQYTTFLKFHENEWYFYSDDQDQNIYEQISILLNKPMRKKLNPLSLVEKCHPRWSKQQYIQAFDQVQEYIKAGDCYQINLTQEFIATAQGSLLDQAQNLWELTHAPYAGYLKIDDFELLSCSPELFIEFQANRKIKTRPIKGTMPRFEDDQQDQISKNKLSQSEKDQAENVMIVDLLRNDLSVYAEIGSVETTKLFEIESFNQVHHMVSEITAVLKEDVNPIEMLLSALPGGSITGAPKIRAMQIIEELEGAPRGAYCGSLGYFNFDGTGRWNILIRSIQKYQDQLSLWAGGGITIASNAEAEYQECFDKISAMLDLINTWQMSEN
ncbi:aminodeoxychorismate synthase, component I [Acinetobacter tjernbergiae DSM 14971 = CIP 107465]|uniref:Aminodeoxychorismate synthase, component I n=2 Tax=Acinetobacter tjernbergiae TaxID=202955 RepID=V2V613_9GAMM|nr:aminodeoxychorismate synthase, component I [Acinetobacter tjernbergiae DSM 14971 = CIP 107465]